MQDEKQSTAFGRLLQEYRLRAGLTQEALAEVAGLGRRSIQGLERGENVPHRGTLQRLIRVLALSPAERICFEAVAQPSRHSRSVDVHKPDHLLPDARSETTRRHNLPALLTSFISRENEKRKIETLLSTKRLVTLTGTGGCGKTRLALQIGRDLVGAYADGVWLIELAPVGNATFLAQTFARALGVAEEPPTPILRTLLDVLGSRHLLLLVDNCEHLIGACAELIETVLKACPNLTVLATSREPLGLGGEVAWRVPSLPLPPLPSDARTPSPGNPEKEIPGSPCPSPRGALSASRLEEVAESAAVQLFVERATSSDPTFAVTPANATAVAQICHRLDGIPLALELAAARLKVLNVAQIADRLDDRFQLLTGGSRTALPRQQTLRATLDWSYNLLSDPERRTLRCLSIFSSGCTLEATEAVCQDTNVLDLLSQLVDKSLVLVDKSKDEPRYGLQETIRQYGYDRLVEANEVREARERHRDWFLALAERAESELLGSRQVEWINRLEAEQDNLRVAIEWSLDANPEVGARLAGHLWLFWFIQSQISEGIRWMDAALAVAPPGTALYAKLLAANGLLLRDRTDQNRLERSKACSEEALSLCRVIGDNQVGGWALNNLGCIALHEDTAQARLLLEESVRLFRASGDRAGVGMVLRDLATVAMREHRDDRAHDLYEESLRILRTIGDTWNLAWTLAQFGELARRQNKYGRARVMARESLGLFQEIRTGDGIIRAQQVIGDIALSVGELDEARAVLVAIAARFQAREIGPAYRIDRCLCSLGKLAVQQGDPRRGVVLIRAGLTHLGHLVVMSESDHANNEASLAAARSALGEDDFARAWAKGEAMTRAQAITYALEEDGR